MPRSKLRGFFCIEQLLRTLWGSISEIRCKYAEIAAENGWGRVEWWCLKWNKPSLDFYASLGARQMDEWVPLRLDGEKLEHLGKKELKK